MRSRLPMLVVTAFFVAMNVLLWRSEFGGHQFGVTVPPETVWEKVLTAPDTSLLTIRHHGKKIGTCQWSASVGQDHAAGQILSEEGMIDEPTSYSIDVNGTVFIDEINRVRFNVDLNLATNQDWQRFSVHVSLRPSVWELEALAAHQSVRLHIDDGQERSDKVFTFAELHNPQKLLTELGGPLLSAALSPLGLGARTGTEAQSKSSIGLQWQGYYDRLKLGKDWMRVYRLQARLLDRFQAVIFVSPVGEILKVELPDQLVLVNDALANLSGPEDDRIDSRR